MKEINKEAARAEKEKTEFDQEAFFKVIHYGQLKKVALCNVLLLGQLGPLSHKNIEAVKDFLDGFQPGSKIRVCN
jgi:hypothetical protein